MHVGKSVTATLFLKILYLTILLFQLLLSFQSRDNQGFTESICNTSIYTLQCLASNAAHYSVSCFTARTLGNVSGLKVQRQMNEALTSGLKLCGLAYLLSPGAPLAVADPLAAPSVPLCRSRHHSCSSLRPYCE